MPARTLMRKSPRSRASIREFGFNSPVLVDGENGIIAGHGRLLAAPKLGHRPILISSGFHSEAVNKVVSGTATSAHHLGLAADFTCPTFGTPLAVCHAIAARGIEFDQLIHEKGSRVHLGLSQGPPTQMLTFDG